MSATRAALDISVSGALRGGGDLRLAFTGVPLRSPLKPVEMAVTAATASENPSFEVALTMEFDPARADAAHPLGEMRTNAASGIKIEATFGSQA